METEDGLLIFMFVLYLSEQISVIHILLQSLVRICLCSIHLIVCVCVCLALATCLEEKQRRVFCPGAVNYSLIRESETSANVNH